MAGVTPLTYQVLLALADGDLHGYGIVKEIEQRSGPTAAPSTGALYLALQRMEAAGLIAEAPRPPDDGGDARRRYYRITSRGRSVAEAESRGLEALVAAARRKKLIAGEAG